MNVSNDIIPVVIDTREQLPYSFPTRWSVFHKALATGDYSLLGHEHCFTIERKSLSDLLGCIFTDRFARELQRMAEFQKAYLAIETTPLNIKNFNTYKGNPQAVLGKLQSISLKYGIHVMFLENRQESQSYVQGLLQKYYKHLLTKANKKQQEEAAYAAPFTS